MALHPAQHQASRVRCVRAGDVEHLLRVSYLGMEQSPLFVSANTGPQEKKNTKLNRNPTQRSAIWRYSELLATKISARRRKKKKISTRHQKPILGTLLSRTPPEARKKTKKKHKNPRAKKVPKTQKFSHLSPLILNRTPQSFPTPATEKSVDEYFTPNHPPPSAETPKQWQKTTKNDQKHGQKHTPNSKKRLRRTDKKSRNSSKHPETVQYTKGNRGNKKKFQKPAADTTIRKATKITQNTPKTTKTVTNHLLR